MKNIPILASRLYLPLMFAGVLITCFGPFLFDIVTALVIGDIIFVVGLLDWRFSVIFRVWRAV